MGKDIELEGALALPARAKVALGLAAAQRVLPRIAPRKLALVAYQKALADGWRWVVLERFEPRQVHRHIDGLMQNHFDWCETAQQSAACQAAIFSLYAATHAAGLSANDLAQITPRVVIDVLERAAEAAEVPEFERAWQLVRLRELKARGDEPLAPVDLGVDVPGFDAEAERRAEVTRLDYLQTAVQKAQPRNI